MENIPERKSCAMGGLVRGAFAVCIVAISFSAQSAVPLENEDKAYGALHERITERIHLWPGLAPHETESSLGRYAYDEKNRAPSVGAETEGITGSIKSYGAIAPENFPCGSIFDVMIHPSTVAGDKGLKVFRMLVEQFFAGGGVAMNINVVSPETLRAAQKHPEKYENLQVRVAGWNIRWNDIPRKEQDEYIRRIETVGGGL